MTGEILNRELTALAGVELQATELEREVVALFDLLRDRLLRYLLTFRLDPADCDEIVQEAFLELFNHLRRGRSRSNLRAWLFRVVHNQALKRIQGRRSAVDAAPAGQPGVEIADPAPSVERELCRLQDFARLQAVLRALPEPDRRCLVLRAEGLRYREIARVLGISLGAVAGSLSKSLARMARAREL